ncbi:GTP-binding protein HflX [Silvibacterium bohemicum]|uniref:GTPase HflX n=1 Tax=Silvibacterium bohemicum TaxID=1577686 RepID=A0A841JU42_9BACT|nr:GTPase HflX [Silvibacterium bohemicum]MBB6143259.1 GTP-binding protein HflX [Silvibacterium bohemicum]
MSSVKPSDALSRSHEIALLVAVEFGGQRRSLSRTAALARNAAVAHIDGHDILSDEDFNVPSTGAVIPSPTFDLQASLEEFRELILSAGAEIGAEVIQRRPKPDPATLLGSGKVEEIAGIAASIHADVILFDHDLTPTQLRNLEEALPCRIVDRTQLILDIFARHARTREGQLQVELAQLEYMLPRLTGRGASMSQLGGGIGTRGPGETQLETDRRRIQRRLVHLKEELEGVRRVRTQQRQRREAVPVPAVALVGYTNAGKSTLFNTITKAGVLESSRMFATLDPKLKAILLPSRRKVLLSDTVGFIRNLPHTLVTSFRATLEEVQKAEVLLHVRDCSSEMQDEHKAEVEKVLDELGVLGKPRIEVLNKIDLLPEAEREVLVASGAVAVSAKSGWGITELLERVDAALVADPIVEQQFEVPQSEGGILAALGAGSLIRERRFEGDSVVMTVAGPASLMGRYRQYWRLDGN